MSEEFVPAECDAADLIWVVGCMLGYLVSLQCVVCLCCKISMISRVKSGQGVQEANAIVTHVKYKEGKGSVSRGPHAGEGGREETYNINYEYDAVRPDGSQVRMATRNHDVGRARPVVTEGDDIVVKYLPETPEFSMWEREDSLQPKEAVEVICTWLFWGPVCFGPPVWLSVVLTIPFIFLLGIKALDPEADPEDEDATWGVTFGCLSQPGHGMGVLILAVLAGCVASVVVSLVTCGRRGVWPCCVPCFRFIGEMGAEIQSEPGGSKPSAAAGGAETVGNAAEA